MFLRNAGVLERESARERNKRPNSSRSPRDGYKTRKFKVTPSET